MKKPAFWILIIVIALLAFGLRWYAAERLHVDNDEPVYLTVAMEYNNFIRTGQLKELSLSETTFEHPALYKIIYGIALLSQPPLDTLKVEDIPRMAPIYSTWTRGWNMIGRYVSVVLATAAVAVLTWFTPLAGLFLAVHTLSVKFTSEFYLESLPLLTSVLCVLAYWRWFSFVKGMPYISRKSFYWLVVSAVLLGMTAASKYIYCVAGVAIGVHFCLAVVKKQLPVRSLYLLIGWGELAILMFFVFNPYLWTNPINRLGNTLVFHMLYAQTDFVRNFHAPLWQPFCWLSNPFACYDPQPSSAFLIQIDPLIFGLALIGLPRLARKNDLFFIWLVIGIVMLMMWSTKWAHYALIVLVPLSAAAAEGTYTLIALLHQIYSTLKIKHHAAR